MSAENLLDHFAMLKGIAERRRRTEVVETLLGNSKLMVVDEPTAGLDPAERVRFLNLLSELDENSVVLLSTHIVEGRE